MSIPFNSKISEISEKGNGFGEDGIEIDGFGEGVLGLGIGVMEIDGLGEVVLGLGLIVV
jgi:hypothetical protein